MKAQSCSSSARLLRAPIPINSIGDIAAWLRALKAAANPALPKDAAKVFTSLYCGLRAAARKLEAIDEA
jgi:hypothetical protein